MKFVAPLLGLMVGVVLSPALPAMSAEKSQPLFEFHPHWASQCQVVNDDVMGGVSRSRFAVTNGIATFQGEVSLDNNGGFASVRLPLSHATVTNCNALLIRVRGDGKTYKFTARQSDEFSGANYQLSFPTRRGEWIEVRLPFVEFTPTFRGRVLRNAPPLDPTRIVSLGFMISDRQAGPFQLEIAWIKALPPDAAAL